MSPMFQQPDSFFQKLFELVHINSNQPQHIRVSEMGQSLPGCLRKLEKAAKLPVGDLYITGKPRKVSNFPLPRDGVSHSINSKTSKEREKDKSKKGYILGHVFEALGPIKLSLEERRLLNRSEAVLIANAETFLFYGFLHISKNCPGNYRDNVCTTCGDVSK